MTSLKSIRLDDRAVLRLSGADARNFLQGIITNDIAGVTQAHAIYAALLSAQGKYLHDFFIAQAGDAFLIDAEAARLDDLVRRLNLYKLRAKLTIERTDFAVVAVIGDAVADSLGLARERGAAKPLDGGVAFVDPRLVDAGARIVAPVAALPAFAAATRADYDAVRLRLGLPDGTRDLLPDKSFILENGFEELAGVDFDKGCYVGQEVTARMKHRALVRKRLVPVAIEGPAPAPGTPVTRDGIEVGEIRSAQDGRGLALIRIDAVGGPLNAGATAVTPQKPAWANF
jgi:folate-binding protein YgfZ